MAGEVTPLSGAAAGSWGLVYSKGRKMMKNLALLLLPLAFLSSCINPFFEKLLKETPEKIEIEASLSWHNDWIEEGQGLARDIDNEFASVPGNPLKAVHTKFFQDSFVPSNTSPVKVYPAQEWQHESGGTSAAFVIYYRIPGVDDYNSTTENLYFRVSWDGGAHWGNWAWAVDSTDIADDDSFEIKDSSLLFKTGQIFATDNSGWDKKGNYLTVEIVLFETPPVPASAPSSPQDRTDILSVRKRLKQRIFTVDLSDVIFYPTNGFPPIL
jgi:hypothetical protein